MIYSDKQGIRQGRKEGTLYESNDCNDCRIAESQLLLSEQKYVMAHTEGRQGDRTRAISKRLQLDVFTELLSPVTPLSVLLSLT